MEMMSVTSVKVIPLRKWCQLAVRDRTNHNFSADFPCYLQMELRLKTQGNGCNVKV